MAKRKVYDEDFKKMIVELYENKKQKKAQAITKWRNLKKKIWN